MIAPTRLFGIIFTIILFSTVVVYAGELAIPHEFEAGKKAVAAEVNENFDAVLTEVNDNDSSITDNTSTISGNTNTIAVNTSDISDNTNAIDANTSDISDIETRVTEAETNISGNADEIYNTANAISDINEKLEILSDCAYGRFCDIGNGTIRDNKTGLIWFKNAGLYSTQIWADANTIVDNLNAEDSDWLTDGSEAGDWRLPTRTEWEEFVVNDKGYTPAMCDASGTGQWTSEDAFIDIRNAYQWSSTESGTTNVLIMFMTSGSIFSLSKNGSVSGGWVRVWPVRDNF